MFAPYFSLLLACSGAKIDLHDSGTSGVDDSDAVIDEGDDSAHDSAPAEDSDPTTGDDTGDDSSPPEDSDPPVEECVEDASLSVVSATLTMGALAQTAHLEAALSAEAALGVACTDDADSAERLYWETEPGTEFSLDLVGFGPGREYTCQVAAVCPRMTGTPEALTLSTTPHPAEIPQLDVEFHESIDPTGPAMLVTNTGPCRGGGDIFVVIYDLDGVLRWYYELTQAGYNDVVAQYHGDGQLVWGGGFNSSGAPHVLDLMGNELYHASWEGSTRNTFTHEGRQLDDGRLLAFAWVNNSSGGASWTGFQVFLTEPGSDELQWEWNSQYGLDQGALPPYNGEGYHGNWADIVTYKDGSDRLYASLCYLDSVIAVDYDSKEMLWRFGPDGDFTLKDSTGAALPDSQYPDCQHGVEVDGDKLLIYDNGASRGYSRAVEYTLDEETMTATLNWDWTDFGWNYSWLGDIDYLPDDHILVTQAHQTCYWGPDGAVNHYKEFDIGSGETVWRASFPDDDYFTYRSERGDVCDKMPLVKWCEDAAAKWEAASIFE
jgi:hypothetical protein